MQQMYADLYAAVARQAIKDWSDGYSSPKHMDAAHWLEAAGLLDHARTNGPVRRAGRTRSTHDDRRTSGESAWTPPGRAARH